MPTNPPRSRAVRASILVALLALAGCGLVGGGDDGDDTKAPPANQPAPELSKAVPLPTGTAPAEIGADDPTEAMDCAGQRAALGIAGTGRDLLVAVRVCAKPAAGSQYWVVARSDNGLYYPKLAVDSVPDRYEYPIRLGPAVVRGSSRTFVVLLVPAAGLQWMADARDHDTESTWAGGARADLPAGIVPASNDVTSTVK